MGSDGSAIAETDGQEDYSEQEDRLSVYEYGGMLTAGLGFFMPLVTLPVAGYCAYMIRDWKPATASIVVSVALATIVFWAFVVVFVIQPSFVESQIAS